MRVKIVTPMDMGLYESCVPKDSLGTVVNIYTTGTIITGYETKMDHMDLRVCIFPSAFKNGSVIIIEENEND